MITVLALAVLALLVATALILTVISARRRARRTEVTRQQDEEKTTAAAQKHKRLEFEPRETANASATKPTEVSAETSDQPLPPVMEALQQHTEKNPSHHATGLLTADVEVEVPMPDDDALPATTTEAEQRTEQEARITANTPAASADSEAQVAAQHEIPLPATVNAQQPVEHTGADEPNISAETEATIQHKVDPPATDETQQDMETATLSLPSAPIKSPPRYRPPTRVSASTTPPRSRTPSSSEREASDRALPIDVRLVFEKAGFCRVSFLPRRLLDMPTEISLSGSGAPSGLIALQDDWYQDVVLPNTGLLLRSGIAWTGKLSEAEQTKWLLSGREIYVLARHNELSGYVSSTRLVIGEEHVVVCVSEKLNEVLNSIALTDSPNPFQLESKSGLPEGWIGLRGVIPRKPITPSADGDILNVLRPLADAEISLESGIRIDRQAWLCGFPPRIRLRGDITAVDSVQIDGRDAVLDERGDYVAPGWNSIGEHRVSCAVGSRSYSIREGAEEWEPWDAYRWSLGETAGNVERYPAICGVLVRPPSSGPADRRPVLVPSSNPVLIGAVPGEIEFCTPRGDERANYCLGFPSFEPVWALPANAMRCHKHLARVILIGVSRSVAPAAPNLAACDETRKRRGHYYKIYEWSAAIRAAGNKRLPVEPPGSVLAAQWKEYTRRAKTIWRRMR